MPVDQTPLKDQLAEIVRLAKQHQAQHDRDAHEAEHRDQPGTPHTLIVVKDGKGLP